MNSKSTVLELNGITKSYRSPEGTETKVLKGIDLSVSQGEALAIVGPSGSGKSTLLNIMGTLDKPSAGSIVLNGRNLLELNNSELAALRAHDIGFIFQLHHLLPQCSVLENVLVPTLAVDKPKNNEQRALHLLDRVGLSHRISYRPGQLSGGECQRVAVVRALINRPKLLLADEPTGSLDREGSENLAKLLGDLNREEQVTLIVVTHSMHLAEKMGRVLTIRDGKISR